MAKKDSVEAMKESKPEGNYDNKGRGARAKTGQKSINK